MGFVALVSATNNDGGKSESVLFPCASSVVVVALNWMWLCVARACFLGGCLFRMSSLGDECAISCVCVCACVRV